MATDLEKLVLSISADTTALKRQMENAQRDTKASADKIKRSVESIGNANVGGVSKSLQAMQADAKNLTFQLNDITQGLLGGQSPFQVMMQQGSQVSQILSSSGGLGNTLKTLGSSLMGMVNPAGLAANALIFAAGMAVQYFTSTDDSAEETAKTLKKHADEIDAIADRWKDALPEVKAYIDGIKEGAAAAQKLADQQKLTADVVSGFKEGSAEELTRIRSDTQRLIQQLRLAGETAQANQLQSLLNAWKAEIAAGRDGIEQFKALQTELTKVATAGNSTANTIAKAMDDKLTPAVKRVHDEVRRVQKAFEDAAGGMPAFLAGIGAPQEGFAAGVASEQGAAASRAFLKTRAADAKVAARIDQLDERFAVALAKLFEHLPSSARINSAARTFEEQAAAYRRYQQGGGLAAPPGRSHHERRNRGGAILEPAAADIGGVDAKTLAEAVAKVKELEQLKGHAYEIDKVHVQLAGQNIKTQRDAAQASVDATNEEIRAAETRAEKAKQGQEAYEAAIKTQQEAIDTQLKENQINVDATKTLDQKKLAIEANRIAKELDDAATKNGIQLTEQVIAQHQRLAMSMAQAKLAGENIAAANKAVEQSQKDAAKAAERFAQQIGQTAQTAISGFINDLRNGVEAGEAFANMLDRIVDSIINMALQSLFDPKGMFGQFISSLSGVAAGTAHGGGTIGMSESHDGRRFSPALWNDAPRFHSGGVVGLRPGEVPIVAQRGEIVVPRSALGKTGTTGKVDQSVHQDNKISIDMGGSGFVAANNKDAKQVGENIQLLIQAELVRQSRPGGILRKVPG